MPATLFQVVVCAAIVNTEGKVLIAERRADKKLGGFWEFPGGKLEVGESLEDALRREIKEELNISIQVKHLLHIQPYSYEHGAVLILFYLCDSPQGALQLTDHSQVLWSTMAELKNLKLLPANAEALEELSAYVK